MDLELQGRRALVTAASYGLGFACVKSLLEEGASVAFCSRTESSVESALSALREAGHEQCYGFCSDIGKAEQLQTVVERAKALLGGIDILVVCTGHPPTYSFTHATDADWTAGIDLVLKPVITLTRDVLAEMQAQNYGRLIFIGSVFGLEPEVSSVIQSTLRTGLNAFSKCVATETAKNGVTANVICPGYFDTPLCRALAQKYADESNSTSQEVLENWVQASPIGEYGQPEDLGALVAFLASPKAKFITGTSMAIDGGFLKGY